MSCLKTVNLRNPRFRTPQFRDLRTENPPYIGYIWIKALIYLLLNVHKWKYIRSFLINVHNILWNSSSLRPPVRKPTKPSQKYFLAITPLSSVHSRRSNFTKKASVRVSHRDSAGAAHMNEDARIRYDRPWPINFFSTTADNVPKSSFKVWKDPFPGVYTFLDSLLDRQKRRKKHHTAWVSVT